VCEFWGETCHKRFRGWLVIHHSQAEQTWRRSCCASWKLGVEGGGAQDRRGGIGVTRVLFPAERHRLTSSFNDALVRVCVGNLEVQSSTIRLNEALSSGRRPSLGISPAAARLCIRAAR